MINKKNKSDGMEYCANSEMIPTRELMKSSRKRDYEKAKAARKAKRQAQKEQTEQERAEARNERDKSLWASLKRGVDLPSDE